MGGVQAGVMFHNTPLSLYEMPCVLHGGSPFQVSGHTDNAACGRLGTGTAARAIADLKLCRRSQASIGTPSIESIRR